MSTPYDIAKQSGYTDEEINDYFSQKDPNFSDKYQQAIEQGYEPQEIYQFLKKPEEKENTLENINRQITRTGARAAETILGAPRAASEFLESIIPEKALIKGAEKIGLGKGAKNLIDLQKKYSPYKLLPSSEQIRENVTKYLWGEKLEPKNKWEEKADQLTSDFAALALPLPGHQLKLLKPALTALGGNIASDVVGRMGGSEKQKTFTKLGTFLAGSLFNPKGANKLRDDLYNKARKALPEDATVSSHSLGSTLDTLEKQLKKGGIAASDRPALEKISDLKQGMQGAQIPVDFLQSAKKKINESLAGIYKTLEGNKPGIKSAKRNLEQVGKAVDDSLTLYGKQNPEWEAFYRPANEVHGAIAQSQRVRNWLKKKKASLGSTGALALFGIEQAVGLPGSLQILGAGAGALPAAELTARIFKSPTLRKYYKNIVKASLEENVVVARENLKKLQEEFEENQ